NKAFSYGSTVLLYISSVLAYGCSVPVPAAAGSGTWKSPSVLRTGILPLGNKDGFIVNGEVGSRYEPLIRTLQACVSPSGHPAPSVLSIHLVGPSSSPGAPINSK